MTKSMIKNKVKVVQIPLLGSDSDTQSSKQKVLQISMQIKKIPKLGSHQRVKQAKAQNQKKLSKADTEVQDQKYKTQILKQSDQKETQSKKMKMLEVSEVPAASIPSIQKGVLFRNNVSSQLSITKAAVNKCKNNTASCQELFSKTRQKEIRKANPDLSATQIIMQCEKEWKQMSHLEKNAFKILGQANQKHEKTNIISKYQISPASSQKSTDTTMNINLLINPIKSQTINLDGIDSKVTKRSAYRLFINKSSKELKFENPDASLSEIRRLQLAKWTLMNDQMKESWSESVPTISKNDFQSEFEQIIEQNPKQINVQNAPKQSQIKSGYDIFQDQTIQKVMNQQPDIQKQQALNVIRETWNIVSVDVKNFYDKLAVQDQNQM